jgi:hypothetical protein
MDSASALRAIAVVLAAAAGLGASACGGSSAGGPGAASANHQPPPGGLKPEGRDARITGGEPDQVHARVAAALSLAGHTCRASTDRVLCDGESTRSASFYVVYRSYPARLLFGSPWMLKTPCDQAAGAINKFNWTYDEISASCDERGTMVVQGAYFVPENGLTARDVVSFARWWSLAEVRALQASDVGPLLQ